MIQDLVNGQHFLNQVDFLAGYTLDQAVPGPRFSFAAFVTSRSLTGSPFLILLLGMVGGALIFLPGTLLVFFATPLWQEYRNLHYVRHFLKGVSIVVAAIITWTAFKQMPLLNDSLSMWLVFLASLAFLLYKKIPAPLIVMASLLLGLLWG
jgi:chromate transporter